MKNALERCIYFLGPLCYVHTILAFLYWAYWAFCDFSVKSFYNQNIKKLLEVLKISIRNYWHYQEFFQV